MSYSKDFRKRTIEYVNEGHTWEETLKVFKISRSTLSNWLEKQRKTGEINCKKREYKPQISEEALLEFLKNHPDAYQYELAEHFGCSQSTICRLLKRFKITRKK